MSAEKHDRKAFVHQPVGHEGGVGVLHQLVRRAPRLGRALGARVRSLDLLRQGIDPVLAEAERCVLDVRPRETIATPITMPTASATNTAASDAT